MPPRVHDLLGRPDQEPLCFVRLSDHAHNVSSATDGGSTQMALINEKCQVSGVSDSAHPTLILSLGGDAPK
jgi:hypothetical protein